MDKKQLDRAKKELEGVLSKQKKLRPANFAASKSIKKAALDPQSQRLRHRNFLIYLVIGLSTLSFLFLVVIIVFQMIMRTHTPQYMGVSDTVINIVAVSVFAQVIAVVATIAKLVFKD